MFDAATALTITDEIIDSIDLATYLAWHDACTKRWLAEGPDRWAGGTILDLAFWAERGIHTARDYANMLDAECAREDRKSQMAGDDYWDDEEDEAFERHRLEMLEKDPMGFRFLSQAERDEAGIVLNL